MTASDTLGLVSILISICVFIYTYVTNTKKYELTYQYRCEVLKWFNDTIHVLMRLKQECKLGFPNQDLRNELLTSLSAKIEMGRFYFPNVDKGDKFGKEKPFAYRNYRNLMLDFLVYAYNIYNRADAIKYLKHADLLQKEFTSLLFETFNPTAFLKETKKVTDRTFVKELSFEDFLNENPEALKDYI
jgi:hypothetical protein